MTRMIVQPNLVAFEAYANAQIQSVESKVQSCVADAGSSSSHPPINFIRVVTSEVNLIVHGINQSNLASRDVANMLPAIKRLGGHLDRCVSSFETANWFTKFRYAEAIRNFSEAADRLDSLVETFSMSQDDRFFEFIREATKESVA